MVVWRVNFFFEQGDHSWSETYWPASTIPIDAAKVMASNLARARIETLGRAATLRGSPRLTDIRISDELIRRDAYPLTDFQTLLPTYKYPGALTPVQPHDVLVLRGETADGTRRKTFYLSSIPSAAYNSEEGLENGMPEWWGKWIQFRQQLLNNWAVYALKQLTPAGPFEYQIRNMVSNGNRVALLGGPPPTPGQYIQLNRGRFRAGSPIIRGRFYTVPSTTGETTIIVPGLTQPVVYLDGGTARIVEYELFPLTNVQIVGKTSRKRGVESGFVRRGRRTVKK